MTPTRSPLHAYYAHGMHTYGTEQEARDVEMIRSLGFRCLNPNHKVHSEGYRKRGDMSYFEDLVISCQVVIFRPFSDGRIGAGVAKEIAAARKAGISVLEMPVLPQLKFRTLSIEETRARIRESRARRCRERLFDRIAPTMEPLDVRYSMHDAQAERLKRIDLRHATVGDEAARRRIDELCGITSDVEAAHGPFGQD